MTTQQALPDTGRDPPSASGARLRLRSDTPIPGYIDGAWWPRSDDLAAELPDLLALLRPRLGPIHRVTYHLTEWSSVPRRFADAGRRVRLDGYRLKPVHTLDVLGVDGERIALFVVPPKTVRDVVDATMDATTRFANPSTIAALLTATARARRDHVEGAAAEHIWD
ncbi:DUF5994 family protein, partial [Nocardia gipuzkoensis]